MKRMLALLLACCMIFALAACGEAAKTETPAETTEEAPAEEAPAEETPVEETPAEPEETPAEDGPMIEDYLYPGDAIPDFTVTLADGSRFTLSEALEKYDCVMLNCWGTWCNPCCMELPVLQSAYAQYKDRIGLCCLSDQDSEEDIDAFIEENGYQDLPLGVDTVGLSSAIIQEGYPTTIIVDKFGNYAYYECGSILDEGGFTRMWDYFLSEDYTESTVVDSIPGEKYEGVWSTDEELTAALCSDGSVSICNNTEDEYAWPYIATENGAVNTNALKTSTYASMIVNFDAEAGDVLAFDYTADFETLYDEINVIVNGNVEKSILAGGEGTCAIEIPADDSYCVYIEYYQNTAAAETDTTGNVEIGNVRLATGDEAAAILAAQPQYPYALSGYDYALEVMSESAKKVVLVFPEGTDQDVIDAYTSVDMYIIPEETGLFRMLLGDGYNAEAAYGIGDYDYLPHICSQCETDGEGYIFEAALSSVEAGSYSNTYVTILPDAADGYTYEMIYVYKSEENMNYYCAYEIYDYNNDYETIEGVTWTYEDGTLPSTDAIAQEPSEYLYNIYLVDENGEPVDGVMINVCTDQNCTPTNTESGYYGFNADPYAYVIHVLKVPDGYSFDTTQEFVMDAEGGDLIITIPHA